MGGFPQLSRDPVNSAALQAKRRPDGLRASCAARLVLSSLGLPTGSLLALVAGDVENTETWVAICLVSVSLCLCVSVRVPGSLKGNQTEKHAYLA